MKNNNLPVSTAYPENIVINYDQKRFTTPQGKLFQTLELQQLRKTLKYVKKGGKCLEVGCGTGRFVLNLLNWGFRVDAVDASLPMLDLAINKCKNNIDANFILAEGAKLPFSSEKYDFVYSIRTINQTESKKYANNMIKELIRVTNQGGIVLIEFCNQWRPFKVRDTVRLSISDFNLLIKKVNYLKRIRFSGILVLSGTLLNLTPKWLLPLFYIFDLLFSTIFPFFASRCYIVLKKTKIT